MEKQNPDERDTMRMFYFTEIIKNQKITQRPFEVGFSYYEPDCKVGGSESSWRLKKLAEYDSKDFSVYSLQYKRPEVNSFGQAVYHMNKFFYDDLRSG
jgi:hypothetical protein